jgi:hypothetical protein
MLFICAGLAAFAALAFFAPLPVASLQDFSVTYFTNRALLNGIAIYDYPAQLDFVKTLTAPNFTFHPYPYPPWFALATLWLGLMPLQVAARAWFLTNLGMLGAVTWLLTRGVRPPQRMLGFLAAVMFFPSFGLLVVGQYSLPVLLGGAVFVSAARRKSAPWLATGLLLMTFKPHIGGLLFLAGCAWLLFEKEPFARRALLLTAAGGLLLAGLGFLADPGWPLSYLQSIGRYQNLPGVQSCGLCASLSVMLIKGLSGQSSTSTAAVLSLVLALGLGLLLFRRVRAIFKQPELLIGLGCVLTLLIDPYLLNYDYVLLLLPFFWLARRSRLVWLAYALPFGMLVLGRDGNVLLVFAAIVTFILILRQPIDAPPMQAYNQINN